jgi:hypothetical protein
MRRLSGALLAICLPASMFLLASCSGENPSEWKPAQVRPLATSMPCVSSMGDAKCMAVLSAIEKLQIKEGQGYGGLGDRLSDLYYSGGFVDGEEDPPYDAAYVMQDSATWTNGTIDGLIYINDTFASQDHSTMIMVLVHELWHFDGLQRADHQAGPDGAQVGLACISSN